MFLINAANRRNAAGFTVDVEVSAAAEASIRNSEDGIVETQKSGRFSGWCV